MDDTYKNKVVIDAMSTILNNMSDMTFIKDTNLVYLAASQSFADLVGLRDPQNIIGKTDVELFADANIAWRYTQDDKILLKSGKSLIGYVEATSNTKGIRGYCQTSKYPIYNDEGQIIGLYGIAKDITREYEAKMNYERELCALFELPENALAAALFDVTNWRIMDIKITDKILNPTTSYSSMDEFTENARDTVIDNKEAYDFFDNVSKELLETLFKEGKRNFSLEYQRLFYNDVKRWVNVNMHFLTDPVNGNLCLMSTVIDIEKQKREEQELVRAAQIDALTGLYNRESTMRQINNFLANNGLNDTHALFMIDVDNFKLVNDTFGHQTGDSVLLDIGKAIKQVFRNIDIIGRVGGDEFFVFMKNVSDINQLHFYANTLVVALQYVCTEQGVSVELSGSVGISQCRGNSKTLETLYAEADNALYKSKRAGKNRYSLADEFINSKKRSQSQQETVQTVHLHKLLENMDGAIMQAEIEGEDIRVVYSSDKTFSVLGESTITGGDNRHSVWSVIVEEDIEPLRKAAIKAAKNNDVLDFTCRIYNPDGGIEWHNICATCLPDQGDGIYRTINLITNITKQKQTEESLKEKNWIIEFSMKNTDINIWYYDVNTKDCVLSENCKRVHNMVDDVLRDFPECIIENGNIREDCIEESREAYRRLREYGEGFQLDVWMRNDGSTDWWCEQIILTALMDDNGKPVRAIGIGKNVTDVKRLEEKYESFQTYRKLAEKNTLTAYRMNLTTDRCSTRITNHPTMQKKDIQNTINEFFEEFLTHLISETDIQQCRSICSREKLLENFRQGNTSLSMEYRYVGLEDRPIWIRTEIDIMQNPDTNDVEAILYSFDIDYDKNMKFIVDILLSTDYEFLGLLDVNTGYLMVFGDNKDVDGMAHNGSFYDDEMRRVFSKLIVDDYFEQGVHAMDRDHVIQQLETKDIYSCSFPAKNFGGTKAGRKQWKFGYLDQSKTQILMTRTDVTDIFTAERDLLTGLYNRQAFYRHARELLDLNPDTEFVLIRCDIDRFKTYNDTYGIQAGDRLLAAMGKNIQTISWPALSVFGHIEADHFSAMLPLKELNTNLWSELNVQALTGLQVDHRLTCSIGIFEITERDIEVSLMCDRALLALRTVKDSYTKKVAWYDDSLRKKLMDEQMLVEDMQDALENEQFVLYFQPQIDYNEGILIGAEVLVRWQHPKRGLISPSEFIPIFEKNGFISRLDSYVWEKSCQYLSGWIEQNPNLPIASISINISRFDIYGNELCQKLKALVEKYNLPISALKLEITESAYMKHPEQLLDIVKELRAEGFIVEMDDFGAGYSSLNTLKDVPVDVLKLDVHFLTRGEDDVRGGLILSSVIRMARWLKVSLIAEGVETKAQADYLKSLSCFYMQGYYFGKPMPADEFREYLRTHKTGEININDNEDIGGAMDIWDPEAQTTFIFNNFLGSAAIIEYDCSHVEILRANDRFYEQLGTTRQEYKEMQKQTLNRFDDENRAKYINMIEDTIKTGNEMQCDIKSLPIKSTDKPFWTHNRVRLLTKSGNHFLLYLTTENITRQKEMEQLLLRSEN